MKALILIILFLYVTINVSHAEPESTLVIASLDGSKLVSPKNQINYVLSACFSDRATRSRLSDIKIKIIDPHDDHSLGQEIKTDWQGCVSWDDSLTVLDGIKGVVEFSRVARSQSFGEINLRFGLLPGGTIVNLNRFSLVQREPPVKAKFRNKSMRLIVTHPTFAFDYLADGYHGINDIFNYFLENEYSINVLVSPNVDWADPFCNSISLTDCAPIYLKYLPKIEKAELRPSYGGEHSIKIVSSETTVLAGGFFEACFAKTFDDTVNNASGNTVKIALYIPGIFYISDLFKTDFKNRLKRMIEDDSNRLIARIDKEKVQIFLNQNGKRHHIFGVGSKIVDLFPVYSTEELLAL